MNRSSLTALIAAAAGLSACTMAPAYHRPSLPIAQNWPNAPTAPASSTPADEIAWRKVFTSPRLQSVVTLAFKQNRDLRIAILNIAKSRAQYDLQNAGFLPSVNATLSDSVSHSPAGVSLFGSALTQKDVSATVGFSAYELDLFGRVRSLSNAARETFLQSVQDRRTSQISLIAEVAGDYLTLAADIDQFNVAQDTLISCSETQALTQKKFEAGAASELDVRQAETLTEGARRDVAAATAQVEQDKNALRLVVGAEIPEDLLPLDGLAGVGALPDVSPGLPSEVLTRRPDVLSAEHSLMSLNANIGAARAALFPTISLTGATGSSSPSLNGLFGAHTGSWSYAPQVSVPIFGEVANLASLKYAEVNRDVAIATYEKTVQTAFREVADALAVRATIQQRLKAQERLTAAAEASLRLSKARFERGVDGYLDLLDAERTLYAAQQNLITLRLTRASNLVTLYKTLGGGSY